MIGIVLLIILTIRIYKSARENNRNGIVWALIAVGTYIGIQLLVGIAFGVTITIGQQFWGWQKDLYEKSVFIINLIAMVLSLIGILFISNYLNKVPDEPNFTAPPEPPKFD